jgi:hypothetical protein
MKLLYPEDDDKIKQPQFSGFGGPGIPKIKGGIHASSITVNLQGPPNLCLAKQSFSQQVTDDIRRAVNADIIPPRPDRLKSSIIDCSWKDAARTYLCKTVSGEARYQ